MNHKIIALILCMCLSAALLTGCGSSIQEYEGEPETEAGASETDADVPETPEEAEEPETEAEEAASGTDADAPEDAAPAEEDGDEDGGDAAPSEEPAPTSEPGLGYAAYEPDTVAAVCEGRDITWREYYYWLNYYAGYVQYMAAMGAPFSGWEANDFSQEQTNGDLVRGSAADTILQYRALAALAERLKLTVEEDELQDYFDQSADSYGDSDGTCTEDEAAAFEEYLDGQFIDRDLFDYMNQVGMLGDKVFTALYGEDGKDLSDQETLAYAEELELLACKHILFLTNSSDADSEESLSQEEIEEKKAKADEIYEQLAEVQDDPEALEELFDELMNEYSEDPGLTYSPDGYQFTSGVMDPVFEETTAGLEEYGLSEPVQSSFGYHIILRLPIDPDGTYTDSSGSGAPLRAAAAQAAMSEQLMDMAEDLDVTWEDGFEKLDLAEIFGE